MINTTKDFSQVLTSIASVICGSPQTLNHHERLNLVFTDPDTLPRQTHA